MDLMYCELPEYEDSCDGAEGSSLKRTSKGCRLELRSPRRVRRSGAGRPSAVMATTLKVK